MKTRVDIKGVGSITGYTSLEEMQADAKGRLLLIARPLVANVPIMEGGTEVECRSCGESCWKRDIEPDPLPENMIAVCTACALQRKFCK